MSGQCRPSKDGFTLVEVLLVIAIIALLATLGIPAAQSAREAARRTQCANNMRQYGLAFGGCEAQQGSFPAGLSMHIVGPLSGDATLEMHDYFVDLLPFLDASSIAAAYRQDTLFCAATNAQAIGTSLSVAVCPSAPDRDPTVSATFTPSLALPGSIRKLPLISTALASLDKKYTTPFTGAITDYSVPLGATIGLAKQLGYGVPPESLQGLSGMFPLPVATTQELLDAAGPLLAGTSGIDLARRMHASEISDGLSHTFMLTEVAGRPEHWKKSGRAETTETLPAAWADPRTLLQLSGTESEGGTDRSPCLLQCDNRDEIYSFHPSGVNFLFADGHVQLAPGDTDLRVIVAWLTPWERDGND